MPPSDRDSLPGSGSDQLPDQARVVIIGAGIVGCSAAYHLTQLGWRDIVVLDQGPLFRAGGSTSHPPGLVFQNNAARTTSKFAQDTVGVYRDLRLDGEPVYWEVGSLEVASTPERWEELKRRHGHATSWGLETHLVAPDEISRMVPMMRSGWAARFWSPVQAAEHRAARERVVLLDARPFVKIEVSGRGALPYLQRIAANQMDHPVGKVTYTAMLNERGGIMTDLTVTRVDEERFWVVTGGGVGMHDLAWMRSQLPDDQSVQLKDLTSGWCCIGVWGPASRDLLQPISQEDLAGAAFPYLTGRSLTVGSVPAYAIRISYVGELGWELYTPTEYGLRLWDTLWQAGQALGVTALGGGAFDSLRLEKGYRLWGSDIHSEYNPYEAGLGFAVRLNEGDFIGRNALLRVKEQGIARKLSCMTLDDPAVAVLGKEPIFALSPTAGSYPPPPAGEGRVGAQAGGREALGYVTSANYGYTVGKSIIYGYLPLEDAAEGNKVEVQYFGRRFPATVVKEPLYDPEMTRLKELPVLAAQGGTR